MSVEKLRRIAAAQHITDGEAVGVVMRDLREALREVDAALAAPRGLAELRRIADAQRITDGEAVGVVMRDLREALREVDAALAGRTPTPDDRPPDGPRAAVDNGGEPVAVSFAHGWTGASAVAAALAEARAHPGRVVTLLGARHPNDGGRVTCHLAFGVVDDPSHAWHGSIRYAVYRDGVPCLMGPGTRCLADADASDAEAAVGLAMRLIDGWAWVFRPLPPAPGEPASRPDGGEGR